MIKERHRTHIVMAFDPTSESGVDHAQWKAIKMGPGYIHELIHEANALGLKGRRITDVIVDVEIKSKQIVVEYHTITMKQVKG